MASSALNSLLIPAESLPLSNVIIFNVPGGNASRLRRSPSRSRYVRPFTRTATGGDLQKGTVETIKGPGKQSIVLPPSETNEDWAVLVKRLSIDV